MGRTTRQLTESRERADDGEEHPDEADDRERLHRSEPRQKPERVATEEHHEPHHEERDPVEVEHG